LTEKKQKTKDTQKEKNEISRRTKAKNGYGHGMKSALFAGG
jgi:ubiquitin